MTIDGPHWTVALHGSPTPKSEFRRRSVIERLTIEMNRARMQAAWRLHRADDLEREICERAQDWRNLYRELDAAIASGKIMQVVRDEAIQQSHSARASMHEARHAQQAAEEKLEAVQDELTRFKARHADLREELQVIADADYGLSGSNASAALAADDAAAKGGPDGQ